MASDITITSLTTVGAVGQVILSAKADAPQGLACLPYLQPAEFEFWSAATNNRAQAVRIAENAVGLHTHAGLTTTATRYYWARVIDPQGEPGAFYPVSATAGIPGAPSNAALDPILDEITADILDEQEARIEADRGTASRLLGVEASYNSISAGARIQFYSQAGVGGYQSQINLEARGGSSGSFNHAGMYIDVSPGNSRVRLVGNKIVLQDSNGNIFAMFSSDGKLLSARIPNLEANQINAIRINGIELRQNGRLITDMIAEAAVTEMGSTNGGYQTAGPGGEVTLAELWIPGGGEKLTVIGTTIAYAGEGFPENSVYLRRDGSTVEEANFRVDDIPSSAATLVHSQGWPGGHTWRLIGKNHGGGGTRASYRNPAIVWIKGKR